MPSSERCTEIIQVSFRSIEELEAKFPGIVGAGISIAPNPVQCGAHKIYTPEELGLFPVKINQEKLDRCKKMEFVLTTGDPTIPRQPGDRVYNVPLF
jgi:hypothetical protein